MIQLLIVASLAAMVHGSYYGMGGSIPMSVYSKHKVKVLHVPSYGYTKPVYATVGPNSVPIYMTFVSKSSPLYPNQYHIGQRGSYQKSYSQDGPHVLKHVVKKPVFQEVREVIQPYRKITQVIKPVMEKIVTKVAKRAYAPPKYGPPAYAAPKYGPPAYAPPKYGPPAYAAPKYGPPAYAAPKYGPPAYLSPKYSPPKYSPPPYGAPKYAGPSYAPPPPKYSPPSYGGGEYDHGYEDGYGAASEEHAPVSYAPEANGSYDETEGSYADSEADPGAPYGGVANAGYNGAEDDANEEEDGHDDGEY